MRFGKPEKKARAQRTQQRPVEQPSTRKTPKPLQPTGATVEQQIAFDPADGHDHDGTGSHTVDHNNLANVTSDQHHAKQHNLWDTAHHGDLTAGTPANGDLIYRDTTWKRLAKSTNGFVLKLTAGLPAWADFAHNLLSASHSDTLADSVAAGDLLYGNNTPKWARLPKSTNGFFLWLSSGLPAWVQLAFSHIAGTITDAQHGALTTSSTHSMAGDVSGTTAAAVVDKLKGKSVTTPTAPTNTGQYLKFDGSGLTWDDPPGDGGDGSDGSDHTLFAHSDTTGAPATGDVVYRNGSSQWTRLAIGATGRFLRVVSGLPAWATAAFSDLTGAISDAQHGALTTSATHALGGDLSGTTAAAVVAKLNGKTAPAPGAGDDLKLIRYNHGSGAYELVTPATVATSAAGFQAWRRLNISAAATSKGQVPGLDAENTGIGMYQDGAIVGVSVDLGWDLSNSGSDWYEVEVYKRSPASSLTWAATGVTARITGGAGDQVHANGSGSVAFAQGDQLTMFDQRQNLGGASIPSKVTVYVVFN